MVLHVNYEIRWKNYRAFEDTGWITIRPLTILIGPNNAGKSSVISPLLLMNQTMSSRDTVTPLVTRGPLVDAGSFQDIIHNRDVGKELFLGFRFHVHDKKGRLRKLGAYPPGAIEVTLTSGPSDDILLKRYKLYDAYKREFIHQYRRSDGYYMFKNYQDNGMEKEEKSAIRRTKPANFLFSASSIMYNFYQPDDPDKAAHSQKFSKGFSNYLRTIGFAFEELRGLFSYLTYIGPLRARPRRYYEIAGEIPGSVGSRGEHTAHLLHRHFNDYKKDLNNWIKRFEFGDQIRINPVSPELFSLSFETKSPKTTTNIADAGFGASHVLPLVVQTLAARRGSLTIAEQPEIHLNPRLQCVLADLFAEMANSDHRVIVETHSEHMLLRLRRLVASGNIKHDKVAIYFVEKTGDVATIRSIPLKENGHISPEVWPKGFFGESLRESLGLAAEQSRSNSNKG